MKTIKLNKRLNRGAFFTDVHFGKKSNSPVHNQDCLNYIDWFCEQVRSDPSIDYVAFLGDWNESRSAIGISTLNFSHEGASKLNSLGVPIFWCVGNHDLLYRTSRDVHSIVTFAEFDNIIIINEPTVVEDFDGGMMFSPFMFHSEYPGLTAFLSVPVWAGHFEFQGFVVTGHSVKMPHGPSASDFKGPRKIFSGHFHKRQVQDNIVYIGNTFPMDFSDAGDNQRGMMVYQTDTDEMNFIDWPDCPKYVKVNLSTLLDENTVITKQARVKCIVDVPITYEESVALRQTFVKDYELREFTMEESDELREILSSTEVSDDVQSSSLDGSEEATTVDELVLQMLSGIKSDKIDNAVLIEMYNRLNVA